MDCNGNRKNFKEIKRNAFEGIYSNYIYNKRDGDIHLQTHIIYPYTHIHAPSSHTHAITLRKHLQKVKFYTKVLIKSELTHVLSTTKEIASRKAEKALFQN